MNPLVKKEILLMLPAWLAVLVLEGALPWLFFDFESAIHLLPLFFFLGVIIPAVSSFGREFSTGSFLLLMSQPVERERIWRTKLAILICATASIFLVYLASCWLRTTVFPSEFSILAYRLGFADHEFLWAMSASGIGALIALASGLWTTLLFRQVATAFWITLLVPAALLVLIGFFLPKNASGTTFLTVFGITAGVYVVAAFWLARQLFYRAQDVGWTGGHVSLSRWRYFEARSKSLSTIREHRPVWALLRKEFQLHSTTFFGAGIMLGLQILVFFLRAHYLNSNRNSGVLVFSCFFWLLWLAFPLFIGCTLIAEERRLGMLEQQFCLPISRRLQFTIKFFTVLILGILLGGVMPGLLETIAAHVEIPNEMFLQKIWLLAMPVWLFILSVGFSLAALFGSSLARNFLQALSIAILVIIFCPVLIFLIASFDSQLELLGNASVFRLALFILIALPTIPIALIWLSYLNFNYFQDGRRVWRNNLSILIGMLVFICFMVKVIYPRPWELLTPIKSPSNIVRLSSQTPVKLSVGDNIISAVLPDGRLWVEESGLLNYFTGFGPNFPPGNSSQGSTVHLPKMAFFMDGSNWMETAADDSEAFGIRSDGTLWGMQTRIAREHQAVSMGLEQMGTDTNWSQVASGGGNFLLLKTDGSLWRSGTYISSSVDSGWIFGATWPERIENETNWVKIFSGRPPSAEKTDGSAWNWQTEVNKTSWYSHLVQDTKSLAPGISSFGDWAFEVDTNGDLWFLSEPPANWRWGTGTVPTDSKKIQFGQGAKWKFATFTDWDWAIMALRSDGTLWKWQLPQRHNFNIDKIQAKQMGSYANWINLPSLNGYGIVLAADGGLWVWGTRPSPPWLAPSRQPVYFGNIFSTNSITP